MNEEVVKDEKIIKKIEKQEIKRFKKETGLSRGFSEHYYKNYIESGVYDVDQMIDLYDADIGPEIFLGYKNTSKDKLTIDEMIFLRNKKISSDNFSYYTKLNLNIEDMVKYHEAVRWPTAVKGFFQIGITDPKYMKELMDKYVYREDFVLKKRVDNDVKAPELNKLLKTLVIEYRKIELMTELYRLELKILKNLLRL